MMQKEGSKKILYILMLGGILWMYASYIPFLMDYYVMRPDEPFGDFFQRYVGDGVYTYETLLVALLLGVFLVLFRKGTVGVVIVSLAMFVLSHASYIKYLNRKELLRLDDLQLTEVAGMAANYLDFSADGYLAIWLGVLIAFVVAALILDVVYTKWSKGAAKETKGLHPVWSVVVRMAAALGIVGVIGIYSVHFFESMSRVDAVDTRELVRERGNQYVLYSFVRNDHLKTITTENVGESYSFFLDNEPMRETKGNVRPNVIVIMNESWWNTDLCDESKISFSEDPMAPYKELPDGCIKGYLTSNVYGGGTVSSEADFLTGLNTKYCKGDTLVFVHTMDRKLPSLVDYFKALDYETVAMHPYYGWFYCRNEVYENLGFDRAIFDEDMEYRDVYTQYISDDSLVKQIIKEYETGSENKFIWAVSVANHKTVLEYDRPKNKNYEFPISVELASDELGEEDRETLTSYVNGIYDAGEAYRTLIDYFEDKEEPVVVVMFGDHIPNFSPQTLEAIGLDMNSDSVDMLKRLYSVPVVMWSNYQTEDISTPEGESIYYLPQILLEYADLPDSDMTRILRNQRKRFRTNVRSFVTDESGKAMETCSQEDIQLLNHAKSIIYDLMYGESIGQNVWLPCEKQ